MYTIYADGELLYTPHLSDVGYGVFSPELTLELNKPGSLNFTIPSDNVRYDSLKKLNTMIDIYFDDVKMFHGRVLSDDTDFYRQRAVYCEGELAFLLDSLSRPHTYTGTVSDYFTFLLTNHNSHVEETKHFQPGIIDVELPSDNITIEITTYPMTYDTIQEQLLEPYGGYLRIREEAGTRYLDWLKESGKQSTQTIEFGRNLLDFAEYISAEEVFTVLLPLGKHVTESDGNGNAVDYTVNLQMIGLGETVESEAAIQLFGRIERQQTWDDIEDPNVLKQVAEEYLAKSIEMAVTLTVRAVDLSLIDIYYEAIHLGDWVRVISLPHSIDTWFQCTKIIYNLIDPEQTEYTFGVDYTSLTSIQADSNKNINTSVQYLGETLRKEFVDNTTFANRQHEVDSSLTEIRARLDDVEASAPAAYDGSYSVTPSVNGVSLETSGRVMTENVTIDPIPYSEVDNASGGRTVHIGNSIEGGVS